VAGPDDLGARLEVTKEGKFSHPQKLSARPARSSKNSSDSVIQTAGPYHQLTPSRYTKGAT
jgi:hypothetical protein